MFYILLSIGYKPGSQGIILAILSLQILCLLAYNKSFRRSNTEQLRYLPVGIYPSTVINYAEDVIMRLLRKNVGIDLTLNSALGPCAQARPGRALVSTNNYLLKYAIPPVDYAKSDVAITL